MPRSRVFMSKSARGVVEPARRQTLPAVSRSHQQSDAVTRGHWCARPTIKAAAEVCRRGARMTKLLLAFAILMPAVLSAQVAHRLGSVHTPEVDLGYETFGASGAEIPIIAVNGGPGLSHAYMMQNDLWQRVAAHRLVVLYDQRGTGASKHLQPNAPQSMEAQVADLDAVREALTLDHVAVLGDSYGGMIAMAYAAAHPEHVARLILSDSAAPSWKAWSICYRKSSRTVKSRARRKPKSLAPILRRQLVQAWSIICARCFTPRKCAMPILHTWAIWVSSLRLAVPFNKRPRISISRRR